MKLSINGKVHTVEADSDTPLLWVLREQLGLTGTKYGCGLAQCGACTVHIDGVATRTCMVPASALREDQQITTIEGLGVQQYHPVQQAWAELDVAQCGYCQSGMMMAAAALLKRNPNPSEDDIRREMTNICRCGTYPRVIEGILTAAKNINAQTSEGEPSNG